MVGYDDGLTASLPGKLHESCTNSCLLRGTNQPHGILSGNFNDQLDHDPIRMESTSKMQNLNECTINRDTVEIKGIPITPVYTPFSAAFIDDPCRPPPCTVYGIHVCTITRTHVIHKYQILGLYYHFGRIHISNNYHYLERNHTAV
jgi:hypothetical protein